MSRHKSARDVAEQIISANAYQIDYMAAAEQVSNLICRGDLPEMEDEQFDEFFDKVWFEIDHSSVEVRFE